MVGVCSATGLMAEHETLLNGEGDKWAAVLAWVIVLIGSRAVEPVEGEEGLAAP